MSVSASAAESSLSSTLTSLSAAKAAVLIELAIARTEMQCFRFLICSFLRLNVSLASELPFETERAWKTLIPCSCEGDSAAIGFVSKETTARALKTFVLHAADDDSSGSLPQAIPHRLTRFSHARPFGDPFHPLLLGGHFTVKFLHPNAASLPLSPSSIVPMYAGVCSVADGLHSGPLREGGHRQPSKQGIRSNL